MAKKKGAPNFGKSYADWEIAMLFFLDISEPEAQEIVAKRLRRTPGAIDAINAWKEKEEQLPKESRNRIVRQIAAARARFGTHMESCIKVR